ncbi:hypothetical protein E1J38_012940 [Seonamhaeicola sediminis]|uniref:Tetratricopeptide repeat protein n=1 Tax=Seonamhaeicola sediminis TaxID=2528206 RepID=A0A562YC41_9FLAO|nr:tetratricopeptide repeat protein [Seonamhaeicola sediminis]TWO31662.1 hypothetical protein E1J38_012940 [Seonamhaeicola sediminis]
MKQLIITLLFPALAFCQTSIKEAETLIKDKQYEKAEFIINNYLNHKPKDVKVLELLGDVLCYQKKWDKGIEIYRGLVEEYPYSANYHYKYGGALGMKALIVNKFKAVSIIGDAKTHFLRAAELDSEHVDVRWALVELYMQLPGIIGGSKSKALQYANEMEQLSKVDGYLAKGYIHEVDDEPEQAEAFYKNALSIGGSVNCFEKLSNFYENQKQPDKAIKTIEQAYEKHNKNTMHYQIGKVCADYNIQLEKGERCLKMFIENHSVKDGVPIEWAYFRLAQIYKNKLDKSSALKWIDKALIEKNNFVQAKEEKAKILAL